MQDTENKQVYKAALTSFSTHNEKQKSYPLFKS